MSQTDDLRSRLDKAGLGAIANELINQSKEAVAMKAAVVPDDAVPLGASKIGGLPDLPASLAWPKWKTGELSFVVQVNLAELPENDMLPSSGLLSFFYDREQSAWGFDPQHKEGFRLWYFPETSGLNRTRAPESLSFPCARLTFEPFLSLPDSSVIGDLALEMEKDEIYAEFLGKYPGDGPRHQILGWPKTIQNAMELECQLASNGLYVGDPSGYRDPRRKELEPGAPDWMLLLQIDSDDKTQMMWGDVGMLYVWIRYADLKQHNFAEAWTILQCY
jgi:uncharacterized protein YwqG